MKFLLEEPKTTYSEFIENIIKTRGQWSEEVLNSPRGCERHHIIPACMGGSGDFISNGRSIFSRKSHNPNCIYLYPEEHSKAHELLYKENPEKYSLYAAWIGTTKNGLVNMDEYADLKQFNHTLPQEILNKIQAAGTFRYNIPKEYKRNPAYKQHVIKDPEAFRKQKSDQCSCEGNPMFGHGERVSGGNNGHASIRYFYDGKAFECRDDLIAYLKSIGIYITSSAIRAVVHGTGTNRVYQMYKNVFDKLDWEYK